MTITTKATAKVAAVAAGLAMATSMLSLAPLAHAADACSVGATDLTVGSTGAAVICLQTTLVAGGYLTMPAGVSMGYFGPLTKAAVAKWQAASGVAPAVGYFGPISRTAFTGVASVSIPGCAAGDKFSSTTGQACTTTTSTVPGCSAGDLFSSTTGQSCTSSSTSTAGLTGNGYLTNVNSLGDITTALHAGDDATKVIGLSMDATGGDVALQRVDATFVVGTTGSQSANLNKYVSDVSLYLDGKKIASMDPASGDQSSVTWTYRFTGLNSVIKSGTTGNLYVEVTPVSSVGSNEDGNGFTVKLLANSVRAVGADGISDTYVASGDTVVTGNSITVSSATAGTLTVSPAADNPDAGQVTTSSSTTSGVVLLNFNMKPKNQNVKVTDLVVSFGTSAGNTLTNVIGTVYLKKGSDTISSKTISSSATYATVTFNNVNQSLSQDTTTEYSVVADLKAQTAAAYSDGTTLIASTTTSGWTVADADGASVSPSAAAQGNTQTLTGTGITVTAGTPTTTTTTGLSGAGDNTQYTIPFTVKAGDSDIYIGGATTRLASAVTTPSASAGGINYATSTGSTHGATGMPTTPVFGPVDTKSQDSVGSYYYVPAGTSRTFSFTTAITATTTGSVTSGFTGVQIVGINYGSSSTLGTTYYTANLNGLKTQPVYMTAR
ncbi:hypothetical protein COU19_02200 [Candidatus Kaiserbacteria bacterium CG10_big_fil_rev_8_21_14_0_10_56_12]|uniref:Peptidoglycan binding-like domain-containing protein n=1 Tax=Candidatus Kaiserbacteria bacterium CG10_big_fil_rev_8_21_14_0_10_56_12 TaxID=1974611 RepID=A0A2H0U9L4_9BACT|nr:MAG: hypothetical protein COU19_02200 [Candidatus Kaiserbacteria bacterium CG10_big_fil_rev_8_21_14_0_10_56_12]